jgi:hypothetical protein
MDGAGQTTAAVRCAQRSVRAQRTVVRPYSNTRTIHTHTCLFRQHTHTHPHPPRGWHPSHRHHHRVHHSVKPAEGNRSRLVLALGLGLARAGPLAGAGGLAGAGHGGGGRSRRPSLRSPSGATMLRATPAAQNISGLFVRHDIGGSQSNRAQRGAGARPPPPPRCARRCAAAGPVLSRGGCPTRWRSLVNCAHGDAMTASRFGRTSAAASPP